MAARREMAGTLALCANCEGEDRERVLDRFYRVAGAQTTGSGLGLAIVKSIAELQGAQLSLDRSPRLGGLRVQVRFASGG